MLLSKSKTSSPEKNGSGDEEKYEKYLTHRQASLKNLFKAFELLF